LTPDFVSLGHLTFRDFLALDPLTLRRIAADPESRADLELAFADQPDILHRFRRAAAMRPICPMGPMSPTATSAARDRLVRRWAFEVLREKAPALWDALPFYGWDTSIVTRRYEPWKTRFLVAGEVSVSCLTAFRRTAGIWCVEPLRVVREYLEHKAEVLHTKRVQVLAAGLDRIPLPDAAADLAIVGPDLGDDAEASVSEMARACRAVLVLDLRPGAPCPDDDWLSGHGFSPGRGRVGALPTGRPCWWKRPENR
jgi:hypothetical protein